MVSIVPAPMALSVPVAPASQPSSRSRPSPRPRPPVPRGPVRPRRGPRGDWRPGPVSVETSRPRFRARRLEKHVLQAPFPFSRIDPARAMRFLAGPRLFWSPQELSDWHVDA